MRQVYYQNYILNKAAWCCGSGYKFFEQAAPPVVSCEVYTSRYDFMLFPTKPNLFVFLRRQTILKSDIIYL